MVTPGHLFDGYRLIRPIGRGGFGEVWLCRLEVTGEPKALKFLSASDPAQLERELAALIRYRSAVVDLACLNLMTIEHVNRIDAGLFYVMPLADGLSETNPSDETWQPLTLASLVAQRAREPNWFSAEEIRAIIQPVICAVRQLNDAGMVHRDIKPENILFLRGRPCLADVSLLTEDAVQITRRGTPGYAAPTWYLESGANPDMWGLATTLYTLITGNNPDKIGRGAFLYPLQGEASVEKPAWNQFHHAIFRATNGDAAERFLHLDDFAKALVIPQSASLPLSGPPYPVARRFPKARLTVLASAFCILSILVGGGLLWRHLHASRTLSIADQAPAALIPGDSGYDNAVAAASKEFETLLSQAEAKFLKPPSPQLLGKVKELEGKLLNSVNRPVEEMSSILDEMEALAPALHKALTFPSDEEYRKCFADLRSTAELPARLAKNTDEDFRSRRLVEIQKEKVVDFQNKALQLLATYSTTGTPQMQIGKLDAVFPNNVKIRVAVALAGVSSQSPDQSQQATEGRNKILARLYQIVKKSLPKKNGELREILSSFPKLGM